MFKNTQRRSSSINGQDERAGFMMEEEKNRRRGLKKEHWRCISAATNYSTAIKRRRYEQASFEKENHWRSLSRRLNRRRGSGSSKLGLVGARGFEPPTPASRTQCATGLRYAPTRASDTRSGRGIVLQDRGKTQPVCVRHTLAGDLSVPEVDTFGQSGIGADRAIHPVRRQAHDVRQRRVRQCER